jgi:hypothetical protein
LDSTIPITWIPFHGPEWKTQAAKEKKLLDAIGTEAAELGATLAKTPIASGPRRQRPASAAAQRFAETGCRAGGAGADVKG